MAELPDEISSLCDSGNELMDQGCYTDAIRHFEMAWEALPEPKMEWDAASWMLAGIADAHFFVGQFQEMRAALMLAMQSDRNVGNPFFRLRLGQCLVELGEMDEAANWLAGAFLMEGTKLFANDDPKYLNFIKSRLVVPPDGWPEGW
jgi:tetratricopeptide (TPR) repeat protein